MHPNPESPLRRPQLVALFALLAGTLLLEVSLVRVLSFSGWYHFAFFIVSMALLGTGASGVAIAGFERLRRAASSDRAIASAALGFALSTLLLRALLAALAFDPFSLATDPWQLVATPLYLVLSAAPFFFSGLAVALLFVRAPDEANRIYVADLLGAGIGTAFVPATLGFIGGSGAIALAASLGAASVPLFVTGVGRLRLAAAASGVVALALSTAALPIAVTPNKPLREALKDPSAVRYTDWNGISRVDVLEGVDSRGRPADPDTRWIAIDAGAAMTRMPHVTRPISELPPEESHHSSLPFALVKEPSVLVIGSGGGYEVLTALTRGARRVVAAEINPIVTDLVSRRMRDFVGGLFEEPRVTLLNEDGRSALRRLPPNDRFEVIFSTHTISNAAIASGALTLNESTVLTIEAFREEIARLTPSGILYITRPEFQLPRLFVSLARASELQSIGDATTRLFAYRRRPDPLPDGTVPARSFFAACVFSKRSLTADLEEKLTEEARKQGGELLYVPSRRGPDPLLARCAEASDPVRYRDLLRTAGALLEPATDDRPFFNRHARWSDIRPRTLGRLVGLGAGARLALEEEPIAEAVLLLLLLAVGFVSAVLLLLPPWILKRRRIRPPDGGRVFLYFSALGLAFIATEIALMQRFTIYLGDPARALSAVLAALLVSAGFGSALADRHAVDPRRAARTAAVALAIALVALPPASRWVLDATLSLPLGLRVGVAALLVFPCGCLMGMPFPLGIRLLEGEAAPWIPWAWAVNGFFSVTGAVLAQIGGMTFGFTPVLWGAAALYAGAAARVPLARRPRTLR